MPTTAVDEPSMAIVIVNWNRIDDTVACLDSLRRGSYRNYLAIVVDNGSTDASVPTLRAMPDVELVDNGANLGMAAGNNAGVRRALESSPDLIMLLNNDTIVEPDMLSTLAAALAGDRTIGIVAPKMYYYDAPTTLWFAGGRISRWRGDSSHEGMLEEDRGQFDTLREVDYVTSCCLLARREVFEQVGDEDTSYFIYFGETDYCVRARRRGWRIVFVPQARLWHKVSMTMGSGSARYWFHYTRSRIIFVRKNFAPLHRLASLLYITFLDAPRMLAHFVRRRKRECIVPFLKGYGEGLVTRISSP